MYVHKYQNKLHDHTFISALYSLNLILYACKWTYVLIEQLNVGTYSPRNIISPELVCCQVDVKYFVKLHLLIEYAWI
jgi:hypothetical protein